MIDMKEITKETIYDLPVHDADFLWMKISQNNMGETELSLAISFCKGEYESLTGYSDLITPEGLTLFVFSGCEWITNNFFCNRTQRDSIDSIEFKNDTPELVQYSPQKDSTHIEVLFTSGSKIECIVNKVLLTQDVKSSSF